MRQWCRFPGPEQLSWELCPQRRWPQRLGDIQEQMKEEDRKDSKGREVVLGGRGGARGLAGTGGPAGSYLKCWL